MTGGIQIKKTKEEKKMKFMHICRKIMQMFRRIMYAQITIIIRIECKLIK
jgi:hypothetical protein